MRICAYALQQVGYGHCAAAGVVVVSTAVLFLLCLSAIALPNSLPNMMNVLTSARTNGYLDVIIF